MKAIFFPILVVAAAAVLASNVKAQESPAYAVALVNVKDTDKMAEYISQAAPLIKAYGGKVIAKGQVQTLLAGNLKAEAIAVAEFPNGKTIDNFYNSVAYQAIIPLRDQAADVVFFTVGTKKYKE